MLASSKYIPLIKKYFPQNEWATAIAVCQAESSGNPNAANLAPTENHGWYAGRASDPKFTMGSFGLFQLGAFAADNTYKGADGQPVYGIQRLYEPETNICIAAQIFKQRGTGSVKRWTDWGAFTNGAYKQYFNEATHDLSRYKPPQAVSQAQPIPKPIQTPSPQAQAKNQPKDESFWDGIDVDYKKLDKEVADAPKVVSKVLADRYKIFDDAKQLGTSSAIGSFIHQLWDKAVMNIEDQFKWLEYFHESADAAFEFLLLPAVIVGVAVLEKRLYRKLVKEKANPNLFIVMVFSLWSSKLYTNKKLEEENAKLKTN